MGVLVPEHWHSQRRESRRQSWKNEKPQKESQESWARGQNCLVRRRGRRTTAYPCSWSSLHPTTPFLSIIDSFHHISHQSDARWIPFLQPFALSLLLPCSPHLIQGWVPLCFDITTQICLFPLHAASSAQPVGQFLICSSSYVATCCY